jgi:hypothetical protein
LLFNANSAIFQLYHCENKLIFNEKMMRSALYETNTLSWIFFYSASSLKQQSTGRHVAPLGHIILIPRANQSLFFLLNAACLPEKQQLPFYSLWFDPTGARTHDRPHSNSRSTALEANTLTVWCEMYRKYKQWLPTIPFSTIK